jgi:hypothetical protein
MAETAEITTENLQNLSFELIKKLMGKWRDPGFEFESVDKKVAWMFAQGSRLHTMVIDALRYNQNLQDLAKLHKVIEELESEREIARKSGILTQPIQNTQ